MQTLIKLFTEQSRNSAEPYQIVHREVIESSVDSYLNVHRAVKEQCSLLSNC